MPRIRPVIRDDQRRGQSSRPGFLLPFGCRRSLLGHPIPAGGLGLPYGRLTGPRPGPHRGYHVPHVRVATGVGASCTPRTAMLTRLTGFLQLAPAASQRPVPAPRTTSHQRGLPSRGINGGSRNSPVRSSPCLWPPDGTGALGLLPRASHPAGRTGRRTSGWGQAIEHEPETMPSTSAEPPICIVYSSTCDLVSQRPDDSLMTS
jgi:hypothetical protein